MAKELFKANGLQYEEHNVATDMFRRQEMIENSGQMGVPVIMIDKDLVIGFNKPVITDLLGLSDKVTA